MAKRLNKEQVFALDWKLTRTTTKNNGNEVLIELAKDTQEDYWLGFVMVSVVNGTLVIKVPRKPRIKLVRY